MPVETYRNRGIECSGKILGKVTAREFMEVDLGTKFSIENEYDTIVNVRNRSGEVVKRMKARVYEGPYMDEGDYVKIKIYQFGRNNSSVIRVRVRYSSDIEDADLEELHTTMRDAGLVRVVKRDGKSLKRDK